MKKLHFLICAMLNHTQIKAIVRVFFPALSSQIFPTLKHELGMSKDRA